MPELERRLLALGRELDYPPAPDLAAAVRARIDAGTTGPRDPRRAATARPRAVRALVIAALIVLGLAATALAVSPAARDALRDLLDIGGVEIESTPKPAPAPAARGPLLGEPSTLSDAPGELGFEPLVPRSLGAPDRVHVDSSVPGLALALVYAPSSRLPRTTTTGVGLLITELRGGIAGEYLHKVVPQATRVERLRVDGRRAAWIAGAPHFFFYGAEAGGIAEHELEVAQNVLLVDRGPVLVRLEGAFGRREAVRIARSLAPP